MRHNIRQRVINEFGLPVTKVTSVNGELGSGILDKNGKEIFEGDKVRYDDGNIDTVVFGYGMFCLPGKNEVVESWHDKLEIIGHAEDWTMRFIRTVDGDYINAANVEKFFVQGNEVMVAIYDDEAVIAEGFDSADEAQKWLDELIDKLESDED